MVATYEGHSVGANVDETELQSGQTKESCLELCLQHDDANGCQFRTSSRCWKWTGEVEGGSGAGHDTCWKLVPAN